MASVLPGDDMTDLVGEPVLDEFSLKISWAGARPTVAVAGDLDLLTAPSLASILVAAIAAGRGSVVVDVLGLTFIDAAGIGVLAQAAGQLRAAGDLLIVQSVSTRTRHLLDLTLVSDSLTFEAPFAQGAATNRLRAVARSNTATLDAALGIVTALVEATLSNADGASVTLERDGRAVTVAASNATVLSMDRHQYETREGPCLDALEEGRAVYIDSLADETRWSSFVPRALGLGIHSILSSPLMVPGGSQGALNIYSTAARAFDAEAQELAARFASQASQVLSTSRPEELDETRDLRIAAALAARQSIHRAQGVIMYREDLSAEQASTALFVQAREAGATVLDRAIEIISTLRSEGGRP